MAAIDEARSARFDSPPKGLEEIYERRVAIRNQISEIMLHQYGTLTSAKVTCVCGRRHALLSSHRCFHCGVYFCAKCCRRHFGPSPFDKLLAEEEE